VVIRADASARMGTGHVMRCLALGQAWKRAGGRAVFALATKEPAIESRLSADGFDVRFIAADPGSDEDAFLTCDLALSESANFVIADGYHFGSRYQALIKKGGRGLLFMDDYGHADRYFADIVLNQNIYASQDLYMAREPYTRLLLGSPYVLLRKEFWPWRGWRREIPLMARKVLITLGGSDPDNVTLKTVKALQHLEIDGLEVVVVIGGSNTHCNDIKAELENCSVPILLVQNASNMPALMAWADVAVSSASTTSWELAFMGLPALVLILADNQIRVAEKLAKVGAAVNLGWYSSISEEAFLQELTSLLSNRSLRATMAGIGQRLVDGLGSVRVISALLEEVIHVREASEEDCGRIYRWANDPDARASSFSTDFIPWDEHVKWFEKMLHSPDCTLFVALDSEGHPLGQVRFELKGNEATISTGIDSNFRGRGLGGLVVLRAVDEIFKKRPISRINAFIKPGNLRSIRTFEKAGFCRAGIEIVKGNEAIHYIKERT
jgi:UDP-2,4-diacetamido-2,4,6-trideoxy-beta-L-altropyranose hydrolase